MVGGTVGNGRGNRRCMDGGIRVSFCILFGVYPGIRVSGLLCRWTNTEPSGAWSNSIMITSCGKLVITPARHLGNVRNPTNICGKLVLDFNLLSQMLHVCTIDLHDWAIFWVNVGKYSNYSSTMEHLGLENHQWILQEAHSCQITIRLPSKWHWHKIEDTYGGFLNWGYPNSWMV